MSRRPGKTVTATWWHGERDIRFGPASRSPDRETLAELVHLSDGEAGRHWQVEPSTFARWRRRAGVHKPNGMPRLSSLLINDTTRRILTRFNALGFTQKEIAAHTGLTVERVRQLQRRCGVRPKAGRPRRRRRTEGAEGG